MAKWHNGKVAKPQGWHRPNIVALVALVALVARR
jgi:hypothetical protein